MCVAGNGRSRYVRVVVPRGVHVGSFVDGAFMSLVGGRGCASRVGGHRDGSAGVAGLEGSPKTYALRHNNNNNTKSRSAS